MGMTTLTKIAVAFVSFLTLGLWINGASAYEPGQEVSATIFCFEADPVMSLAEAYAEGRQSEGQAVIAAATVIGDCISLALPVVIKLERILRPADDRFKVDVWAAWWRGVLVFTTAKAASART